MRRGLSTEVVVRTGAELADEIGFEAVGLSTVARRLEVRTPSLYAHVGGATDLAVRIGALALEDLADRVSDAIAGRSGREALQGLLDCHDEYAHRHPGRYAAMRVRLPVEESPADAAVAAAVTAGKRHADLLRAALHDYALTGDREVHAIRLLSSIVQGFAVIDSVGGFAQSAPPSRESREYIVAALDAMLRT